MFQTACQAQSRCLEIRPSQTNKQKSWYVMSTMREGTTTREMLSEHLKCSSRFWILLFLKAALLKFVIGLLWTILSKTCWNGSLLNTTQKPWGGFAGHVHQVSVYYTHICRRSSGTSSRILMKVLFVVGLFGLTGRNRSSSTISLNVESQAAYSMT